MRLLRKHGPEIATIMVTGLLGLSFAKVMSPEEPDYLILGGGGVFLGAVTVFLLFIFRPEARRFEEQVPPEKLNSMKVMLVGFLMVVAGWLCAVFVWFPLGFSLAGIGILVGILGMGMHFALMTSSNDG